MSDTDHAPTFRQTERPTDAEREAHAAYIEELRAARAEDAQSLRDKLAAQYAETDDKPRAIRR